MTLDVFSQDQMVFLGYARDYFPDIKKSKNTLYLFHEMKSGQFYIGRVIYKNCQPFFLFNEYLSNLILKNINLKVGDIKVFTNKKGAIYIIQKYFKDANSFDCLGRKPLNLFISNFNEMYGMFVFDLLACNPDRHIGNIMLIKDGSKYTIYFIDHEHTFMDLKDIDQYEEKTKLSDIRPFLKLSSRFIDYITDKNVFFKYIDKLQSFGSDVIDNAYKEFHKYKDDVLDVERFKSLYLDRRSRLRDLCNDKFPHIFPKLN